ncbi:hypothetical protein [Maliponia aquimaris]|uniref:Membrane-bound lysozyme-inhibitor of c-type lysozyme n=1 Tax=Maliponia aquimaris TaxID=1673631 RepID=A0A238L8H7_9RHOB|nr:hypothetical protein [Maliponia aquimaris]SMX50616.1 hypothetical protein MAA8898_04884 [Maliponia aquimaris]
MPGGQQVALGAALGAAMLCALATAAPATPVAYACDLIRDAETLRLTFDIDPVSFAPAVDPNDPPRRQVSHVALGNDRFEAEAVLTEDGTRGFWSPERDLMLTLPRTGRVRLSDGADADWRGECKER